MPVSHCHSGSVPCPALAMLAINGITKKRRMGCRIHGVQPKRVIWRKNIIFNQLLYSGIAECVNSIYWCDCEFILFSGVPGNAKFWGLYMVWSNSWLLYCEKNMRTILLAVVKNGKDFLLCWIQIIGIFRSIFCCFTFLLYYNLHTNIIIFIKIFIGKRTFSFVQNLYRFMFKNVKLKPL